MAQFKFIPRNENDKAVLDALRSRNGVHDWVPLSQEDLAREANRPLSAVQRATIRLEEMGVIERRRVYVYQYRILCD